MFIPDPKPTFKATVQISEAGEDGASWDLPVVFNHMLWSEFVNFPIGESTGEELINKLVHEIPGLEEGKSKAAFFDEVLDKYPAAILDLVKCYRRELKASRIKN